MITEKDLQDAIAECQGQRNPNANTCIKLAAFYTIKREMFGEPIEPERYSFAAPPSSRITIDGDSDFLKAVNGRELSDVLPVIDELMETVSIIQPRLYDAVLNRLYR